MINSKDKEQMEQLAQMVQGLTISQCVGLLSFGFGSTDINVKITHRTAKAQNNTIIYGAGIEPPLMAKGIKGIFASVRICLTEKEIKKMSKAYEVDEASLPKAIVEDLLWGIPAGHLEDFFSCFKNVERNFSILTDDYTEYPACG